MAQLDAMQVNDPDIKTKFPVVRFHWIRDDLMSSTASPYATVLSLAFDLTTVYASWAQWERPSEGIQCKGTITADINQEIVTPTWVAYRDLGDGHQIDWACSDENGASLDASVHLHDHYVTFTPTMETPNTSMGTIRGTLSGSVLDTADIVFSINTDTVTLSLISGWNLISLPLRPNLSAPAAIDSRLKTFWQWNGHRYEKPSQLVPLRGYWVYADQSLNLGMSGSAIAKASVQLCEGWNLAGILSEYTVNAETAFRPPAWEWDSTNRKYETREKGQKLQPGTGYWLQNTSGTSQLETSR